jgi:hypothetical protein
MIVPFAIVIKVPFTLVTNVPFMLGNEYSLDASNACCLYVGNECSLYASNKQTHLTCNRYCETQWKFPLFVINNDCALYVSNKQSLDLRDPQYTPRIHELPIHFPCADTVFVALWRHCLRSCAKRSLHIMCWAGAHTCTPLWTWDMHAGMDAQTFQSMWPLR